MEEKVIEVIVLKVIDFIIKNIASTHGILIVLLILYFTLRVKMSIKVQSKIQTWIGKLQYKLREKDLLNHHVFNRRYAHNVTIDSVRFDDRDKTFIFQNLLKIKVETNLNILEDVIKNKSKWNEYSKPELRKYLNEITVKMLDETDMKFHRKLCTKYDHAGSLIYTYVMNGTLEPDTSVMTRAGFTYFRNIRLKELTDRLDIYFEQDAIYTDNYKIMIGYFTEIDAGTVKAVEQSITLFKHFNGGLTDILNQYYNRKK